MISLKWDATRRRMSAAEASGSREPVSGDGSERLDVQHGALSLAMERMGWPRRRRASSGDNGSQDSGSKVPRSRSQLLSAPSMRRHTLQAWPRTVSAGIGRNSPACPGWRSCALLDGPRVRGGRRCWAATRVHSLDRTKRPVRCDRVQQALPGPKKRRRDEVAASARAAPPR